MDQKRLVLFIVVSGVLYALFYFIYIMPYQRQVDAWKKAHPEQFAAPDAATSPGMTVEMPTTGTVAADAAPTTGPLAAEQAATASAIEGEDDEIAIQTDRYRVVLSSRGGRPESWIYFNPLPENKGIEPIELVPQYAEPDRGELPFELNIKEGNQRGYPQFNTAIYTHQVSAQDDGSTRVVFTSPLIENLLQVEKTYVFRSNSYLTDFQVVLRNLSDKSAVRINDEGRGLGVSWGPGFRHYSPAESPDFRFIRTVYGMPGYVGSAQPNDANDEPVVVEGDIAWAGASDKFFLAAIIPQKAKMTVVEELVRLRNDPNRNPEAPKPLGEGVHSPPFTIVLYNSNFTLPPQQQVALNYFLFVGPKDRKLLASVSERTGAELHRTLFFLSTFRWMRALKIGLMYSLDWLHNLVGNYGIAIILLTILIRLLTHPLAHKGMKMQAQTMAEMQKIKPYLDEVSKKYANDATKRNAETMKLYKEHGISPFAPLRGCLPMLIQIPVFFALYALLNQSIDLRGASFLWMDDLSQPDRLVDLTKYGMAFQIPIFGWRVTAFNLLPILMGASQFVMSKLTPTPSRDPAQKQMMLMFSLFFPIMLYNFPSGLFIYWLINNVWQSVHQLIANRIVRKPPEGVAAAA